MGEWRGREPPQLRDDGKEMNRRQREEDTSEGVIPTNLRPESHRVNCILDWLFARCSLRGRMCLVRSLPRRISPGGFVG